MTATFTVFMDVTMLIGLPYTIGPIVGFTFTVVNEFRRFFGQFLTNFHEILHSLFSIHVVTIPKKSIYEVRLFDMYG